MHFDWEWGRRLTNTEGGGWKKRKNTRICINIKESYYFYLPEITYNIYVLHICV